MIQHFVEFTMISYKEKRKKGTLLPIVTVVLILLPYVILAGEISIDNDNWENYPPDRDLFYCDEEKYLEDNDYYEVCRQKLNESIALLKNRPVLEITLAHAKSLIGKERISFKDKTRPYLVRALYGHKRTGGFSIGDLNKNVWIHHSSLGRFHPKFGKQPLVIFLDFKPENIYITVDINE